RCRPREKKETGRAKEISRQTTAIIRRQIAGRTYGRPDPSPRLLLGRTTPQTFSSWRLSARLDRSTPPAYRGSAALSVAHRLHSRQALLHLFDEPIDRERLWHQPAHASFPQ